jgi:glycosyltransferase involved in cell wall biosynthesis
VQLSELLKERSGCSQGMMVPLISVVITTHNRAEVLPRAIESVFAQTYDNYDIHIVDDGSSDTTRHVAESMVAGRENVHYWRHENRKGLSAARNTGIENSCGEYIAFLDDDDEWKPQSLQKRIGLLENLTPEEISKTGVLYTGCEIHIVDENRVSLNMPRMKGNIRQAICRADIYSIPSTCMFSRGVLERIGGFDENLLSSVDHDIWMNLAKHNYHAHAIDEPLTITFLRKNPKCMTAETSTRIQGVEQYLNKWQDVFEEWFGAKKGKKYLTRYRRRVLTRLAAMKMCEGRWSQAWRLLCHVAAKNNYSPLDIMFLLRIAGADFIKKCVFSKLLCRPKT